MGKKNNHTTQRHTFTISREEEEKLEYIQKIIGKDRMKSAIVRQAVKNLCEHPDLLRNGWEPGTGACKLDVRLQEIYYEMMDAFIDQYNGKFERKLKHGTLIRIAIQTLEVRKGSGILNG